MDNKFHRRNAHWTEKELQFLRDNADKSTGEIAEKLGRTKGSVVAQFTYHKIQRCEKPHFSSEEIEFLRCNPDMPTAEIASKLGRSISSIGHQFAILKIDRKNFVTPDEVEFIKNNLDSMTHEEMAKQLKCPASRIKHIIYKNKIIRKKEDHQKYFNVDCQPKYAYILGWLFADGSVSPRIRRTSLNIQERDGEYLKPFMMDIYPFWKIVHRESPNYRGQPQVYFNCHRKDVALFLSDQWSLHKKSYGMSDEFYDYICSGGEECIKCFLRGFFEGDGCIPRSTICSFIAKRIDYNWTNIDKMIPNNITKKYEYSKRPNNKASFLKFYGTSPLFLQYIYNTDFKAALPRKKNIALAHFAKPYYKEKYGELECPS